MTESFFSRTANLTIGAALAIAILIAVVSVAPIAADRWF
jgi:hypothetical protein